MNVRTNAKWLLPSLVGLASLALVIGSIAIAQEGKKAGAKKPDAKPAAGAPEFKLPPGWTAEDMQACMAAATPGKNQEHLAKGVGVWTGKNTMWMAPGTEPVTTETTSTVTSIMDGRFIRVEVKGEIPGMGPFNGLGIYGYDNVAGQFVATWIDNHGTRMMQGKGELSADGKTLTFKYDHMCPLTKKPTTMRDVETITGPNTKTLEMFGSDPKTGKEFKMMRIEMTKKTTASGK